MQQYTIVIDEEQRRLLEEGIFAFLYQRKSTEELELLAGMLHDLPEEERKEPGIIHGFCY